MSSSSSCCLFPNSSIVQYDNSSSIPPDCSPHLSDVELFHLLSNDSEQLIHWYGECFGPRDPPAITWEELLPPLLVYGLTFILGVIGNILIIITVSKRKSFKSPTNTFLVNLASTDLLLILICLPVKLIKLFSFVWPFGWLMCKLIFYIQDVSAICSVLNLTAMSLERFYVIKYPLQSKRVCTMSQAHRVALSTWLLAVILALPRACIQIQFKVGNKVDGFHFWCIPNWEETFYWQVFQLYMLTIVLVLPSMVMMFAYSSISSQVIGLVNRRQTLTNMLADQIVISDTNQSDKQVNQSLNRSFKDLQRSEAISSSHLSPSTNITRMSSMSSFRLSVDEHSKKSLIKEKALKSAPSFNHSEEKSNMLKVIPMLLMVVVLFIICWSPLLIFDVLQSFDIIPAQLFDEYKHVKTFASLLAYLNSCLNPIIYGFMSASFRQSFKDLLCSNEGTKCALDSQNESQRSIHNQKSKSSSTHGPHSKLCRSSKPICSCNPADPFSICDIHPPFHHPPVIRISTATEEEETGVRETTFVFQPPSCSCQIYLGRLNRSETQAKETQIEETR